MPYSAKDVRARKRIERILLVGQPKCGKTHTAVKTAPKPFIFNTDGRGALDGPVAHGAEFDAEDVFSFKTYERAYAYLKANIKNYETAVFDNVSSFSMMLEDEIRQEVRDDPRVIYPELKRRMTRVIRDLIALPINVIIIGHVDTGADAAEGGFDHMLSISGGAKVTIPMLIQDWIWLEVTVDPSTKEVKREFLLSPAGTWKKAVRSIKDVARMNADFTEFFALAGAGSEYVEGEDVESVEDAAEAVDDNTTDNTSDNAAVDAEVQAETQAEDVEGLPELVTPDDEDEVAVQADAQPISQPAQSVQTTTVKTDIAQSPTNTTWTPNGALPRASTKKQTQPAQRR